MWQFICDCIEMLFISAMVLVPVALLGAVFVLVIMWDKG